MVPSLAALFRVDNILQNSVHCTLKKKEIVRKKSKIIYDDDNDNKMDSNNSNFLLCTWVVQQSRAALSVVVTTAFMHFIQLKVHITYQVLKIQISSHNKINLRFTLCPSFLSSILPPIFPSLPPVHSSKVCIKLLSTIVRAKFERYICIQGCLGVAKEHQSVCTAARQPAQNGLYPL